MDFYVWLLDKKKFFYIALSLKSFTKHFTRIYTRFQQDSTLNPSRLTYWAMPKRVDHTFQAVSIVGFLLSFWIILKNNVGTPSRMSILRI